MRPHATFLSTLLLPCLLLSTTGVMAQVVGRPLSAQQRIEFDRCMEERAGEEGAFAQCVRQIEDGRADEPAVPPTQVEEGATEVDAAPEDPRTQAERDFDALYGNGTPYDPVADPTLPEPAVIPGSYDPWERYNRQMHRFNNAVDRTVARPLARAYVDQLERSNGLSADRLAAVRAALTSAEQASGAQRSSALTQLATRLDADASGSSDAEKVRLLAGAVRALAAVR